MTQNLIIGGGSKVLLAFLAWCVGASMACAQTPAEMAEAGKRYQAKCLSCHQPPDLSFAPDRAFLDGIKSTA